jgi:hypothetical protein
LQYLKQCKQIQLQNGRGHTFDLATASLRTIDKVVVYLPHDSLAYACRRLKHHPSRSVGLIHLIQAVDYLGICQTLITPAEVHEYLQFRSELISQWEDKILDVPEPALVGHYLYGDPGLAPDSAHSKYLDFLERDRKDWDMSRIIQGFGDRIFTGNTPEESHRIISEIAKLNRGELRGFKERFVLSVEKAKDNKLTRPYRIVFPRTGCGFVFVPITEDLLPYQVQGLRNLTHAHKYDQKLSKCIGISVALESKSSFVIHWSYLEFPWQDDPDLAQHLEKNNPFRDVKTSESPRYTFKGI